MSSVKCTGPPGWQVWWCEKKILGVCHKNKTLLPKTIISKVQCLLLKWKNMSYKSPLKRILFGKKISITSRFIVFEMTAQIKQTQQKGEKKKKKERGPINEEIFLTIQPFLGHFWHVLNGDEYAIWTVYCMTSFSYCKDLVRRQQRPKVKLRIPDDK